MLPSERRLRIIDSLNTKETETITSLASSFNVSEMTIRRDLDELDKQNLIKRIHGGAMSINGYRLSKAPLNERKDKYFKEKVNIGKAAATLVNDNDTILFDVGTTTIEVAKNLKDKEEIFTITNSIPIATELSKNENTNVFMIGGFLNDYNQLNLVGNHVSEMLEKFSVDKLFLGAMGFHEKRGLVYFDIEETTIRQKMIEVSKEVNVVIDSSKFGKNGLYSIGAFEKIDTIITDNNILKEHIDFCVSKGIRLVVTNGEKIEVY